MNSTKIKSILSSVMFFALIIFPTNCVNGDDMDAENPEVTVKQGKLRGGIMTTANDVPVFAFTKVPYAQPPVGNLRFQPPLAVKSWGDATIDATKDGPTCFQPSLDQKSMSEDCLYLNVYTTKLPGSDNSTLRPVLVYLPGTMNMIVSSDSGTYGPQFMLQRDLVLVVPSFRQGVMGYLTTGDRTIPANNALRDIIMALKWVRENIESFNGDPSRVTLMGHNSGAVNAHLLSMSRSTEGLFHRLITASGTAASGQVCTPTKLHSKVAYQFGRLVNCPAKSSDKLLDCLVRANRDEMMKASLLICAVYMNAMPCWPCATESNDEGAILDMTPYEATRAGKFLTLPWMNMETRDEGLVLGALFHGFPQAIDTAKKLLDVGLTMLPVPYGARVDRNILATRTKGFYFSDTMDDDEFVSALTRVIGDSMTVYPGVVAVRNFAAVANSSVYFGVFAYTGSCSMAYATCGCSESIGVDQGDDTFYLFDNRGKLPTCPSMSETDASMSDRMLSLLYSFVSTGTPMLPDESGSMAWEPYTSSDPNQISIGNDASIEIATHTDYFDERIAFWDKTMTELGAAI